ncbi:MAG: transglutaminase-like domain-containing protein [Betaproteobacteria bacterium]
MDRRTFLKNGAALPTAVAITGLPRLAFASGAENWRIFEVTTSVEVLKPGGGTRIWLPVPLTLDTDYQKSLGNAWTAEGGTVRYTQDPRYRAGIVAAEFPEAVQKPMLRLISRFATRDRAVDLSVKGGGTKEDPAVLRLNLAATELLPTDGIVRKTAQEITKGRKNDLDKARAIYEWTVDNTFRNPQTRGCGVGDIKSMLEAGNLGGKCADLNALFVGLARSIGIPARDVYGVRIAGSRHGYKSLGVSSENITKAQHCRAEFYAQGHGWIPVDPADVRKVVLEEPPGNLAITDEKVQRMRRMLFGAWEMNWLAYNYAHDVQLPGSKGPKVGFFMYPNGETGAGRLDSLDPESFKYIITSRELKSV